MEKFKNIANNFAVKSLTWMLLLFLGSTIQLHAQTNVEQKKFEDIKAKAEKGDPEAQFIIGSFYDFGEGVAVNHVEAVKWYRKAAQQEYERAYCSLGVCFDTGKGVPQDSTEAVKWYLKAANQGDFVAQYNLGDAYYTGRGIPRDYVEAYKWFSLAASQGSKDAGEYLTRIESLMTPDQITEAHQLAHTFKAGDSNSENPTASGSGFFITEDGYLISNYHVVKDSVKVRLVTSVGLIDAKVVSTDMANDLALLKTDGKFSPLSIASSSEVNLGGTVATIGFPNIDLQGFAPKFAKGEIASLSGAEDDPRYFQISVPVQPGNSGGALVDERGNVIGIVSAKLDASTALAMSGSLPENVNYAVKSSLLLSFLESVPAVSAKLKAPNTADEKFEDVVKQAQDAAVLVLVY